MGSDNSALSNTFQPKKFYFKSGIESLPKTKNSIREIDIIEPLLPYLLKYKELEVSSEYVFETYAGKPFNTSDKISIHCVTSIYAVSIIYPLLLLLISTNVGTHNIWPARAS